MTGLDILRTELLTLLAEQTTEGSVAVPWWLRFGVLVYGALLVAALMVYAQTKHQRPWSVIWVLLIACVPIAGAIAYFIAQTVRYRRTGAQHTKGRAERMAPEEYRDQERRDDHGAGPDHGGGEDAGPPPRRPA